MQLSSSSETNPSPGKEGDRRSSGNSPASPTRQRELIEITIKSVMDNVPEKKVLVPSNCLVYDLKVIICKSCGILPEKQLLLYNDEELKVNESPISFYGISRNCIITMNVKMSTGTFRGGNAQIDMLMFVPMPMVDGDLTSLKSTIKTMTHVKGFLPNKKEKTDTQSAIWTPDKKMEHELTRNRMKGLLRAKKKKFLDSSLDGSNATTPGSVYSVSPVESPDELTAPPPNDIILNGKDKPVSEKEIKLFFEPAESMTELLRQKEMFLPPQNYTELKALKEKLALNEKTICKVCRRKLSISEQQILCLCMSAFCKKHRDPVTHLCTIDYKQTGRRKIFKENPKIAEGGVRKAKLN